MAPAPIPPCHRSSRPWQPDQILAEASRRESGDVLPFVVDSLMSELGAESGIIVLDVEGATELLIARESGSRGIDERVTRRSSGARTTATTRHALTLDRARFQRTGSSPDGSEWSLSIPFRRSGSRAALVLRGRSRAELRSCRPDPHKSGQISSVLSATDVVSTLLRDCETLRGGTPGLTAPRSCEERASSGRLRDLFPDLVGRSPALRKVLHRVAEHARTDVPILIEGESGTGKELVAHAIHRLSSRSKGPMVSENCGAIPEHLVESELFGHERGAFTGAQASRPGIVERADGGTLFLDEVSEMDLSLQKKFLRVLQESSVRRVGGSENRRVDMRVVSATNRNLEALVEAGQFRADLFYRLHVAHVRLPPLRERQEDIQLLVGHFARLHGERASRAPVTFTEEALSTLESYSWPGNIRELTNEIWRLSSAGLHEVRAGDLSDRIQHRRIVRKHTAGERLNATKPLDAASHDGTLEEIERRLLGPVFLRVLDECGGNRARAARRLAVGRATLYRRIARYGLEHLIPPDDDPNEAA